MSSVDSIFHSVSTLWSIDIYKKYINPNADDHAVVKFGRATIFLTLITGIMFAWVNVYVKFENPDFALTHWFNEISYYAKNGFVFLIICAAFLINPSKNLVFYVLLGSIIIAVILKWLFPDMNYFNRSTIVIIVTSLVVAIPTWLKSGLQHSRKELITVSDPKVGQLAIALLLSLISCHIIFH
jgi:SSS family solute:Na+ symporter